ncbi:MAG: PLD nuclease N-terminal domain-containing protein [Chloroflexota bacterium]
MLIDCVRNETDPNNRLIWVLIILLTNGIGALLYLFIRSPQRIKTAHQ